MVEEVASVQMRTMGPVGDRILAGFLTMALKFHLMEAIKLSHFR